MAVEIKTIGKGKRVPVRAMKKKAQRILRLLDQAGAELSLALVGDREIGRLNATYRHRTGPTDVLSFPIDGDLPTGPRLLGDVVISVEQAERQARDDGKELEAELETLLIHGILHLMGYDHESSTREERRMRRMEKRIRRGLCETEEPKV